MNKRSHDEAFDKIEGYVSNMGRVKKKSYHNATYGHRKNNQYYVFSTTLVHRITCYKFNGPADVKNKRFTVDHKNGLKHDNRASNLRWLSHSEQTHAERNHYKKTRRSNAPKLRKPVEVVKPDGSSSYFESIKDAKEKLAITYYVLKKGLKEPDYRYQGYAFKKVKRDQVEIYDGEEWRQAQCLGKTLNGWSVSNFGRFKSPAGIISYGNFVTQGYYKIYGAKTECPCHRVVLETFIGPPPASMLHVTVDHIDRDPTNNRLENLRYATGVMQSANRKQAKKREIMLTCRNLIDNTVESFTSVVSAQKKTKIRKEVIYDCCFNLNSIENFEFRYANPILLEGEIWVPYYKKDLDYLTSINGKEKEVVSQKQRMGFDYFCPECKGPAYGEIETRPCLACQRGLPTDFTCHWCKDFVYSTTRCGGEKCQEQNCQNMICQDCDEQKFCMRCYEKCLPAEKVDALYVDQIQQLEKRIAALKEKRKMLKNGGVKKEEVKEECAQQ